MGTCTKEKPINLTLSLLYKISSPWHNLLVLRIVVESFVSENSRAITLINRTKKKQSNFIIFYFNNFSK